MTSTEVAAQAVEQLLKSVEGDAVVALQALLEHTQRQAVVAQKSTVASRKAQYRQMWEKFEKNLEADGLIKLSERFDGLIDRIASHPLYHDGVMSAEQAKALMEEHLDTREVAEVLDARKELRKAALFAHIDATLAATGLEDPQNHNGEIEVPECGMKFTREGAGYTEPSLDEGKLRVALGEEAWTMIADKEIVTETRYSLNPTKLLDLAHRDPAVMAKLSDCLIPGKPKTPRLNVRKL